jgi:hypothetical protein
MKSRDYVTIVTAVTRKGGIGSKVDFRQLWAKARYTRKGARSHDSHVVMGEARYPFRDTVADAKRRQHP